MNCPRCNEEFMICGSLNTEEIPKQVARYYFKNYHQDVRFCIKCFFTTYVVPKTYAMVNVFEFMHYNILQQYDNAVKENNLCSILDRKSSQSLMLNFHLPYDDDSLKNFFSNRYQKLILL